MGESSFCESEFIETTFGEMAFSDTTFGESAFGKTPFDELLFGELAFSESSFGKLAFGELAFGKSAFGEMAFSKFTDTKLGPLNTPFLDFQSSYANYLFNVKRPLERSDTIWPPQSDVNIEDKLIYKDASA